MGLIFPREGLMSKFAEKLNALFESKISSTGKRVSIDEVSKATGITAGAISKLRTGKSKNPTYEVVGKLSGYFDVPADYFFDDKVLDDEIDQIALRSVQLTPDGREALLGMIEKILELEKKIASNDKDN